MTTALTAAEIVAEARRLDQEATPGPWKVDGVTPRTGFCIETTTADHIADVMQANAMLSRAEARANADLIAFARTALPHLVAIVEQAMEMRRVLGMRAHVGSNLGEALLAFDALAGGEEKDRG